MKTATRRRALTVEMTSGSLWKNILLFSLPLMMTQVLEVLFNLSDVAIAGKFADYRALGAVGSTTLLVSLFTGLLIGMGSAILRNMQRICGGDPDGKLHLLMDYTDHPRDVADPWYTGDFEATWRDVYEGCTALLKEISG